MPSNSEIDLREEFDNIKQRAINNCMTINIDKTKEIVFHRPSPKHFVYPAPLCRIAHSSSGLVFFFIRLSDNFNYCTHVSATLKLCAQRLYLLRLLQSQGRGRTV